MKRNKTTRRRAPSSLPTARAPRRWLRMLSRAKQQSWQLSQAWTQAWHLLWPARQRPYPAPLHAIYQQGQALAHRVGQDTPYDTQTTYHNRQHLCDVLLSLAFLLQDWRTHHRASPNMPAWDAPHAACALLAALVHDWGHDGRPSSPHPELEEASAQRFAAACPSTNPPWPTLVPVVQHLVRQTHPPQATRVHQTYRQHCLDHQPLDVQLWLGVLLTEADIAVSLQPHLGPALTCALLHEQARWQKQNNHPPSLVQANVQRLYQAFVCSTFISSPCARRLGWHSQHADIGHD